MEARNPVFNEHGGIDCEIAHPELGWVPFTAMPDDATTNKVFEQLKDVASPYVKPRKADQRLYMVSSQAQMRIALHEMGLLDEVNQIAASDAKANIVWQHSPEIRRSSLFIKALKTEKFTEKLIDQIFEKAMATKI